MASLGVVVITTLLKAGADLGLTMGGGRSGQAAYAARVMASAKRKPIGEFEGRSPPEAEKNL